MELTFQRGRKNNKQTDKYMSDGGEGDRDTR